MSRPIRSGGLALRLSLECSMCGYGIVQPAAPDRCPMCQQSAAWVQSRRQPRGDGAS